MEEEEEIAAMIMVEEEEIVAIIVAEEEVTKTKSRLVVMFFGVAIPLGAPAHDASPHGIFRLLLLRLLFPLPPLPLLPCPPLWSVTSFSSSNLSIVEEIHRSPVPVCLLCFAMTPVGHCSRVSSRLEAAGPGVETPITRDRTRSDKNGPR